MKTLSIRTVLVLFGVGLIVSSCKPGRQKLEETITANEQKLFNDTTKMLNTAVAEEELKAYQEYANQYPDDTMAPNYLFKAGDLANGMRKYKEAEDIFTKFDEKYPGHRKAPVSLFLRAFIYDSNLHDVQQAKMLYSEFLQKYPNHELSPSAKASLDQLNMGLTDEQMIKLFEAKQDSLAKAGK